MSKSNGVERREQLISLWLGFKWQLNKSRWMNNRSMLLVLTSFFFILFCKWMMAHLKRHYFDGTLPSTDRYVVIQIHLVH